MSPTSGPCTKMANRLPAGSISVSLPTRRRDPSSKRRSPLFSSPSSYTYSAGRAPPSPPSSSSPTPDLEPSPFSSHSARHPHPNAAAAMMVRCPACDLPVKQADINFHLDANCKSHVANPERENVGTNGQGNNGAGRTPSSSLSQPTPSGKRSASSFFGVHTPSAKRQANGAFSSAAAAAAPRSMPGSNTAPPSTAPASAGADSGGAPSQKPLAGQKRTFGEAGFASSSPTGPEPSGVTRATPERGDASKPSADRDATAPLAKRLKSLSTVPLAERMRPETLDEVEGQELVSRSGILRALIESLPPKGGAGRSAGDPGLPSMILWGASGTGKTTIARCIARYASARFVELNATSTGVAECKKLFAEAASELGLTGRRTIIFCDEIHRFSKTQQDVFLRPVEAGTITLIGATTENPSFKIQNALLSRCRTFTLQKLTEDDVVRIMQRALRAEIERRRIPSVVKSDPDGDGDDDDDDAAASLDAGIAGLLDDEMLRYLAAFSDGDARTALNLLEMALSLACRPGPHPPSKQDIKASLTQTLVYDRAGDQHYDSISAFHKSVRGGDADATLYYLARMLQSGEDALYIARRMIVIASEDVGLADSSLLGLATATHTAVQQVGMPEARIPLAHCAVALALAPKSTRAYRGLGNAMAALREPGVAGLPVPLHLRNAPTRLMRELGCGAEYKYPPNYEDGRVKQTYLPRGLEGRRFLEDRDLGTEIDPDLEA